MFTQCHIRFTRNSRSGAARKRKVSGHDLPPKKKKVALEPSPGETTYRSVTGPTCKPWASRCDCTQCPHRCTLSLTLMQVEELASDNFAYNMRMLETSLQRAFHNDPVRLWSHRGAGTSCPTKPLKNKRCTSFILPLFNVTPVHRNSL
jgi:hypothetical protein